MNRTSLLELPAAVRVEQPSTDARYLLGVDGGATKTLAAVLDLGTHAVHLGHGGPSNEDAVGARAAVDALLAAADEAIAAAGISSEQLGAAVLAIAGTDTESVAHHVRAARTDTWLVVNDVVSAWASATGTGPGVAVISGTGSNVFGVARDGRAWRAGGWGHLLGDEGSGYWFGVQSIKAALRDLEASGPATELSAAVPAFFGTDGVEAVARRVYSEPMSKGEIAAFAVETERVAQAGDPVALGLYELGAAELSTQVIAVIEQAGLHGQFPVGLIGSVFKAGAMFIDPLSRRVRERAPEAIVSVVEMAPVGGSLLLAARACGHADAVAVQALTALIDSALDAEAAAGRSAEGG